MRTTRYPRRDQPQRPSRHLSTRIAAKKRQKQGQGGDRQPGQVSNTLARRMGQAITDIFNKYGPDIYSSIVTSLKDGLKEHLQSGIDQVETEVRDELGRRGVEEAQQHFRSWMNEFVEDLIHHGMDEASVTIEELADSLVAEFSSEEGDAEGDLFDVEDVEVVEEEEVEPVEVPGEGEEEAPAEGEEAPAEGEGVLEPVDLEGLQIEL